MNINIIIIIVSIKANIIISSLFTEIKRTMQ